MIAGRIKSPIRLVGIDIDGNPQENIAELPSIVQEVSSGYKCIYSSTGDVSPWLGYYALDGEKCIGTCGFRYPPKDKRVEIAYFTFPGYEGRGVCN